MTYTFCWKRSSSSSSWMLGDDGGLWEGYAGSWTRRARGNCNVTDWWLCLINVAVDHRSPCVCIQPRVRRVPQYSISRRYRKASCPPKYQLLDRNALPSLQVPIPTSVNLGKYGITWWWSHWCHNMMPHHNGKWRGCDAVAMDRKYDCSLVLDG